MPRIALGVLLELGAVLGELDAARLAAAADQHLRLDHHRIAELVGRGDGLVDRRGGRPVGHRHAVARRRAAFPGIREGPFVVECSAAPRCGGAGTLAEDHLPLPKEVSFVTFDCLRHPDRLGDRGVRRLPEGGRAGRLHDRPRRAHPAVPSRSSTRSRAARTSSTPRCCGAPPCDRRASSAGRSSPRAPASCPTRVPRWPPFRETNAQLERFAKKFEIGLISNIDDKLLGETRRHFRSTSTSSSPRSRSAPTSPTRRTSRSASGASAARRAGSTSPRATTTTSSRASRRKIPVIWVNRHKETLDAAPEEADRRGEDPARGGEAARRRLGRRVRAVGLHADVVVVTVARLADHVHARARRRRGVLHRLAGTSRTSSRSLPGARRAGRLPRRRRCSPRTPTGTTCSAATRSPTRRSACGETDRGAAARRAGRRAARAARLRRRALRRAAAAAVARPGRRRCRCRATARSASRSSSCTPPTGTRPTGWRSGSPWARRARVRRLPLAGRDPVAVGERIARVVPRDARPARAAGRGGRARRARPRRRARRRRAAAILREDRAYLRGLPDAKLPLARRTGAQQKIHAENLARI